MLRHVIIIILLSFGLVACRKSNPESSQEPIVELKRLDLATLRAANALRSNDTARFCAIADSFKTALDAVAVTLGVPTDCHKVMNAIVASSYFPAFTPDVAERFRTDELFSRPLLRMLTSLSEVADSVVIPPRFYTYVSPYNQGIVRVDSVLLIALNHYMGAGYAAYEGMPDYQRALKDPSRIAVDVAEALIKSSLPAPYDPYTPVLSSMLYEGAVLSLMEEVMPYISMAQLLGYDDSQMQWCRENQRNIWKKLAADNLLYSTSALDAAKLINPAPSTLPVHPDSPGRLGRYVGLMIVKEYLKRNPETTPQSILVTASYSRATEFLKKSDYRP